MENLDLKDVKILIVDDYAPMRKLLISILRELGINRLSQSQDAIEAMRDLKSVEPDIIILDALMEPMDGLEFTRKVRHGDTDADPFIPIIMVSGQTEMNFIIRARDSGITEFLAKPISARLVYERICNVVENPRPFVRTENFFGPDRRRHATAFAGEDRRETPHDYGPGAAIATEPEPAASAKA